MKVLTYTFLLTLLGSCAGQEYPYLPTVSTIDIGRYSGTWYEVARYPNRFEKGCSGASAVYSHEDGYIRVTNRCFDADGALIDEARGKAYLVAGSNGAKLRVSFFWPFYGDYWILMLGDDYQYSVVGDPKRKYLWILSRTPEMSNNDIMAIRNHLPGLGYDPDRLYWTNLNFVSSK